MPFLVEFPAGIATSALQGTANTSLSSIDSKTPALQTGRVPVDGSGVTQPVSIAASVAITAASLPLPTGASTSGLQSTANTSLNSIDTKTPALGQALMANSIPVSIASNQSAVAVSGSVSVSNFPASQAVTGAFFQSTQPVSIAASVAVTGPLTDTQIRATALPVSGTVTATGPLTDTQLRATAVPISGTVTASGPLTDTQLRAAVVPVSLSALPALVAGSAIIGKVGIDQTTPGTTNLVAMTNVDVALSTRLKPADTLTGVTTVGTVTTVSTVTAVTAITNQLPAGTNKIGTVDIATAAATAKGTQGANGVPTQALKDSGRNQTNYFMAIQIVSTATDALLSLTGYKAGAAVVATTTPAVVTSGKTYRITSITLTYVTIVTTPGAIRFTLRANLSGVVAIGSPAVANWTVGEPTGIAPVAGKFYTVVLPFPEGLEFPAGTGIGLSQVGIGATGAAAVVGYGIATINGFEY